LDGPLDSSKTSRAKSVHLMCGTPFWGVVAAVACAYLSYSSYSRLRSGDLYGQNDWWTILTWVIWLMLIVGFVSETRCWRERLFFGLLLLNFLLGFVLAAWGSAPLDAVRGARQVSVVLWGCAAIGAVTTLMPVRPVRKVDN
jgi:hypothetical protein